jgi:hypothetical protein
MRYLFGDSFPFPLQYNFLTTIEAFVTAAAHAVVLDFEAARLQAQAAGAIQTREKSLGALEVFHLGIMKAVQDAAAQQTEPSAAEYARKVSEYANAAVEEAKKATQAQVERDRQHTRSEVERRRGEMRTAIETFLTSAQLPSTQSRITMSMNDGRNELSAVFVNPEGLTTGFTLGSHLPQWQIPRKVSEFLQGVSLQIGTKKGWIRKSVEPELVHIDDFVIGGFDLAEDSAEIRLRRKAEQRDCFVFALRRGEAGVDAELHRPLEEEIGERGPTGVEPSDRDQLERLWKALRSGVSDAASHRERLLSVTLDDTNLFDHERLLTFFERIVKVLAPTVSEIARRSPNPDELSLKVENDNGRREEVYLRRLDLVSKLESLPSEAQNIFAPLGLVTDETLTSDDVEFK